MISHTTQASVTHNHTESTENNASEKKKQKQNKKDSLAMEDIKLIGS